MDDVEFLQKIRRRLEESTGVPIELEVNSVEGHSVAVDFSRPVPHVVMGADALKYPGLARMFTQYALLSLRERRQVSQQEFLMFLRRN